jgi:hypothetical protein
MGSVPKRYRNKDRDAPDYEPEVLPSDLGRRIEGFKRNVVFQMLMEEGSAWEAISAMRSRWGVSARTQLPPASSNWPNYPHPEHWLEAYTDEGNPSTEQVEPATRWGLDLDALRDEIVPEAFRWGRVDTSWRSFLAACVLFDPPDQELLAFSKFGGPRPVGIPPADEPYDRDFGFPAHAMAVPPIETLRDADKAELIEGWYWQSIIDEIGERYLKPQGLDVKEILWEVMLETPDLQRRRKELRERETPFRHFITVGEYTTEADVKRAFRLISATLPERAEKGAPQRDLLIAAQCAILYDRHNPPDPSDGRKKTWTYPKLAEKFGLKSERAANKYVEIGRELLKKDRVQ